MTEKIYNCEQERLRYINELKKSSDKITELNGRLEKEAILKQDLENYRLGIKKKKNKNFVINFKRMPKNNK